MNINCPLSKEEYLLLEELKNYYLPERVYYYTNNIESNKNDTYKIAKKKLIRNIILGRKGGIDDRQRIISYYGNLSIIYNTKEKIIAFIRDYKWGYMLNVDEKKKKWLDEHLEITETKEEVKTNINNTYETEKQNNLINNNGVIK